MSQADNQAKPKTRLSKWFINISGLLIILSGLLLLRAPLLINADYFFNYDEAYQGSQIMDLIKGAPLFFYYEGERYAGIFLGLAAAPFLWLFGVSAFAYKLPGLIAYALYILSSYWVVKKIHPPAALTAVLLMIFSPYIVLYVSSNNWQHNLIIFLGNIIFLTLCKIKEAQSPDRGTLFFMGLVTGFSIYSYTYSILYVATVIILAVLSHKQWDFIRSKISVRNLLTWFRVQESRKLKFVGVLDGVIVFFVLAILFSYIFGGFGIDIAGQSILQINKLHKPVGQALILLAIRLLIYRKDLHWDRASNKAGDFLTSIASKDAVLYGVFGFVIGIAPRFASILTGETTKGGQGFDMDFNPAKIVEHLWDLITYYIPEFFDLRDPLIKILNTEGSFIFYCRGGLAIAMAFLIIRSVSDIIVTRWPDLQNIILLKKLKFDLGLALIIFAFLLCSAVVIIQHGADLRYLLPLHGLVSIWVAIYLDKIRLRSKMIFGVFLMAWCGFSLLNTYSFYTNPVPSYPYPMAKVIRNSSVYKYPNLYADVIEFCRVHKISYVYAGLMTAPMLNFYSNGNIVAAVYDQDKLIRRKKHLLSLHNEFAVIVSKNSEHHKIYQKHLNRSSIKYTQHSISNEFLMFNDFVGSTAEIDSLRNLIPAIL